MLGDEAKIPSYRSEQRESYWQGCEHMPCVEREGNGLEGKVGGVLHSHPGGRFCASFVA